MKKRYTCVLFDMDGTLLYTVEDIANSLNITLKEYGYPTHTVEEVKSYINHGAYRLVELALPEDARDKDNVTAVLTRYLEVYKEHVYEKSRPYDGISEMIRNLKANGVRLAIVSNKPDVQTKILAEKCFPENTFDYVSGGGIGLPSKPDPACIEGALAALMVGKEQVLYVGDSYVDVLTARNAGLPCVGVLWGFGGEHSFDTHAPDATVRTAKELEQTILGI